MKTKNKSARVGIFGGTFNPVHLGHLNSVETVLRKQDLEQIFVVPARENPLKQWVDSPSPEQRLQMVQISFEKMAPQVQVDDQEIRRGGPSYTIDTLQAYAEKFPPENLYLIIGADQLHEFDQWKKFDLILDLANLLVTTRPGSELPRSTEELPKGLQDLVALFDRNFIQLKSGRFIEFVRLDDMNISATDIRKRLRTGRNVSKMLSVPVEEFIRSHDLYGPLGPKIGDYEKFTVFCSEVMFGKKGINVRAFDLRKMDAPSEFAVVASGTSTRHTSALAENVMRAVKEEYGVLPQSIEGLSEGRWVLLDYGALIVHLFYDYVRQEYLLEDLWKAGIDMQLQDPSAAK